MVTSGFASSKIESLFPRGIPIGRVTKVDLDELEQYQRVHITPFADLRRFDIVQVLTRRPRGEQAAALPGPPVILVAAAFVRVGRAARCSRWSSRSSGA